MHEGKRNSSSASIIFKNTLTGTEVLMEIDPFQSLAETIQNQYMAYNLNAFAYMYRYCGNELNLHTPLKDLGLGIDAQQELIALGGDASPYIPTVLLIFPDLA